MVLFKEHMVVYDGVSNTERTENEDDGEDKIGFFDGFKQRFFATDCDYCISEIVNKQ